MSLQRESPMHGPLFLVLLLNLFLVLLRGQLKSSRLRQRLKHFTRSVRARCSYSQANPFPTPGLFSSAHNYGRDKSVSSGKKNADKPYKAYFLEAGPEQPESQQTCAEQIIMGSVKCIFGLTAEYPAISKLFP